MLTTSCSTRHPFQIRNRFQICSYHHISKQSWHRRAETGVIFQTERDSTSPFEGATRNGTGTSQMPCVTSEMRPFAYCHPSNHLQNRHKIIQHRKGLQRTTRRHERDRRLKSPPVIIPDMNLLIIISSSVDGDGLESFCLRKRPRHRASGLPPGT
jgi:hypothetical protein